MRSNFRNLYADIFWFGIVLGSSMAFLAVYAARQGASSFQVSLLSAGPAVINLAISMPAGKWLSGRPLIQTAFLSSFWNRLGYLLLIPLPWLLGQSGQVWATVLITLLMSIPGTLLAITFYAAFAEVVPPDQRAMVVGRRNALQALTTTVTSLACGWLLDNISFPLNYQVVFILGATGGLLSTYHISRLRLATEPALTAGRLFPLIVQSAFSSVRRLTQVKWTGGSNSGGAGELRGLLRTPFVRFMFVYYLFYAFQYTAIPIFPIYLVRELNLTDGQISLGSGLFYATMLVASMGLGWLTARLRHHGTLSLGALIFGLYPFLISIAPDATLFWVASLAGGVAWGITYGGLINRLMERAPEENRAAYMAFHNLVLNLGILSGSLLGPLMAEWMGLREMLLVSAGLRLLAGILFIFWG